MRRLTPVAVLTLALAAGCGTPAADSSPPTPAATVDPINTAACQQFAKATDSLTEMAKLIGTGETNGSMLIAYSAKFSLEDMGAGSKLARGDVQQVMERSVAAVEIIHSGARTSTNGRVSMANEIQAVRLTIAEVVRVCKASGADLAINI